MATSDAFFERPKNRVRAQTFFLALIDGDYSFAPALHVFENLTALATPDLIFAIHGVIPMHGCATRTARVETAFRGAAVNSVDILDAFLREIRPAFHLERFSASADDPESGHQLSGLGCPLCAKSRLMHCSNNTCAVGQ